jgi:hypothetical protein
MRISRPINKCQVCACIAFIAIAISIARVAIAAEQGLPKTTKILDPDIIFYDRPQPTISTDGQWVAYVSKGYVCICNVADPKPIQLFEVPNSWTHLLARPEYVDTRWDSGALYRAIGKEGYQNLSAKVTSTICGIRWTHDSQAVVFGVQSNTTTPMKASYDIWYVNTEGKSSNLSHVGPESLTPAVCDAILTRDRRFLVASGYKRALIWDVAANKPRATPFLTLVPSSTSGRWIGVEKDTRQLVITDENFDVVKRFEEYRPARSFGFKLDWSPNERFAIWRNQIGFDYFSNWEGFWIDLDSGKKRELEGRFIDEQFAFTGKGGEFFRAGATAAKSKHGIGGDLTIGTHITMFPGNATSQAKDVWRYNIDRDGSKPGAFTNRPIGFPSVRFDPSCNLFIIGLTRPAGEKPGWIWHLIDRDGNKWPFPGRDNGAYYSPYQVVGFADGGKSIIAYDDKRLFSLPVAAIKGDAK